MKGKRSGPHNRLLPRALLNHNGHVFNPPGSSSSEGYCHFDRTWSHWAGMCSTSLLFWLLFFTLVEFWSVLRARCSYGFMCWFFAFTTGGKTNWRCLFGAGILCRVKSAFYDFIEVHHLFFLFNLLCVGGRHTSWLTSVVAEKGAFDEVRDAVPYAHCFGVALVYSTGLFPEAPVPEETVIGPIM